MTFEFIVKSDNGTVRLTADAVTLHAGSPTPEQAVALRISRSVTLYVPLDRVEEVVAGIRDAARQAAGQPAGCVCGHREDPGVDHRTDGPCTIAAEEPQDHPAAELYVLLRKAGQDPDTAQQLIHAHAAMAVRQHEALNGTTTPAAGQSDTQQQTEGTVIQAPTPQLSYRLEHRGEGESEWRKGRPGLGVHWTSVDRAKVRQRLAEARAQWPQYEHRMVTITTTVAETVTDEAAR